MNFESRNPATGELLGVHPEQLRGIRLAAARPPDPDRSERAHCARWREK